MSGAGRGDDQPELVDALAEAVLAVDGVAALHQGLFGEVASHLPGRRVHGVRVHDNGGVDVHVVVEWGVAVPDTADAVRRAVTSVAPGRPVDVTIADVAARVGRQAEGKEETL